MCQRSPPEGGAVSKGRQTWALAGVAQSGRRQGCAGPVILARAMPRCRSGVCARAYADAGGGQRYCHPSDGRLRALDLQWRLSASHRARARIGARGFQTVQMRDSGSDRIAFRIPATTTDRPFDRLSTSESLRLAFVTSLVGCRLPRCIRLSRVKPQLSSDKLHSAAPNASHGAAASERHGEITQSKMQPLAGER